jgi:hypothetical protein
MTDQYRFSIISPDYLNLLFMTVFRIIYGFCKTRSAITNLITYVDFISPLVGSQRQSDAIYFDVSNVFDRFPHSLLLRKLSVLGISGSYVNSYVVIYPTGNLRSVFHIFFPHLLKYSPAFHMDLSCPIC